MDTSSNMPDTLPPAMARVLAALFLFVGGCAAAPNPAPATPATSATTAPAAPAASIAPAASSAPTSAAPTDAAPPPASTADTQPLAGHEPPRPNPQFPPPENFVWIDQRAGYALADKEPAKINEVTCEVLEIATGKYVAKITGANTAAGGADPTCEQLSPSGHLVSIGNTRGMYWKNWQNKTTACRGIVAPDDSSCVEDDVTPFMFQPPDGPDANLDLHWSKAVVKGATKKVATIPRGLNRDGHTRKWWTVEYCSPAVAVIDDPKGLRTVIDATNGNVKSSQKSDGSPLCP